jgi:hypothetical protein
MTKVSWESDTLIQAVQMLKLYISDRRHDKPCFVTGGFGHGRAYWIKTALRSYGFTPVWLYEWDGIGTVDLDGNKLFPVYDVAGKMPDKLPAPRCFVLMDDPPDVKAHPGLVVAFPQPSQHDLIGFIKSNEMPELLATGCATYDDANAAMMVYAVSGLALQSLPSELENWDTFVKGGPVPVEDAFFPYWAGYHQKPGDWSWNQLWWLRRYVPAPIAARMLDAIRLGWEKGPTVFPYLLKFKTGQGQKQTPEKPVQTVEKSYSAMW